MWNSPKTSEYALWQEHHKGDGWDAGDLDTHLDEASGVPRSARQLDDHGKGGVVSQEFPLPDGPR